MAPTSLSASVTAPIMITYMNNSAVNRRFLEAPQGFSGRRSHEMAAKRPVGARYWAMICAGLDMITPVPIERWDNELYYDADTSAPGKMHPDSPFQHLKVLGTLGKRTKRCDSCYFWLQMAQGMPVSVALSSAWRALTTRCSASRSQRHRPWTRINESCWKWPTSPSGMVVWTRRGGKLTRKALLSRLCNASRKTRILIL